MLRNPSGQFCDDCGKEFESLEDSGLDECIIEMLNEITTCSDCCYNQMVKRFELEERKLIPTIKRKIRTFFKRKNRKNT